MNMANKERKCRLIIHNIRSAHNVGALFRTADGAGVSEIILSGYSPVPPKRNALHVTDAGRAFQKTALGAENSVPWRKVRSLTPLIKQCKKEGYELVALEQAEKSIAYDSYVPKKNVALIVGNEVRGVDRKILKQCDFVLEIPMRGDKNSLNVSVAGGIALYQITSSLTD